jgi:apolipoprotein N-acyltransferase
MQGLSKRFQYSLRLLDEWQASVVCFLSGTATALAFAPQSAWVAIFFTLPLFYLMIESAAARRHALLRGFSFGYGFFMTGTYWIAYALTVDSAKFGWLVPFSILGLSAVMALWFALFGWLVWWRRSGNWLSDMLTFAVLWVVVEYLRSLGIFGFPWNLMGYIALPMGLAQPAAWMGVYGLSLMMVLAGLMPLAWLKHQPGERTATIYSAAVLLVLIAAYAYGMARMPTGNEPSSNVRVRIVQPNIPQSEKWTQAGRLKSLQLHAQLSHMASDAPPADIIIWSETAMPFTLYPDSPWPSRLGTLLSPNTTLLTGVVEADDSKRGDIQVTNSVVAINADGVKAASYDKHQLVPFGEFVPLRHLLPLDKITPGDTDFSRGQGPQTITIAGVPAFSPLVCYEIIFPWLAVNKADRPDWILNVTNDAWYGDSPGPYQHFAMSRMRAIEQGLPLVRAANTGISAVIDSYGQVVRKLPLNQRGIIDQQLPKPLAPTYYARHGESISIFLLLLLLIFTQWRGWVRKI